MNGSAVDRAARQSWVLYVLVLLLVASLGVPFYLDHNRSAQQKKNLQCVTDWANATAARAQRIIDLSNAKNAAQDAINRALAAVLKDLPHTTPKQVKTLASASQTYLGASNDYNNALALHPLPPSPQLACGGKAKPTPSVVIVTKTAPGGGLVTITTTRPATTSTETVGVPQPTTVTAPGVPLPGRVVTVTRTRTRTVTRTVSPPSCLKHPLPPCTLAK